MKEEQHVVIHLFSKEEKEAIGWALENPEECCKGLLAIIWVCILAGLSGFFEGLGYKANTKSKPEISIEQELRNMWNVIVEVETPNLTIRHKLITCELCDNIIDIPKGSDISLEYSCPHCNKDMVIIP